MTAVLGTAFSPILVTLAGITMRFRSEHLIKASVSIFFTLDGRTTFSR